MVTYTAGKTHTFYCSFLTVDNKEPTTITDPKITISHVDSSGNTIIDINEQPLILAAENTYYFKWDIPATAFIGEYNVECEAIVDLEAVEDNFVIQVKE